MAKRFHMSDLNIFRIVNKLSRAGFIEAARGRYGGVSPAAAIRVNEVARAIESTDIAVAGFTVVGRRSQCDTKLHINAIFNAALEAFLAVLDQHTLADMSLARRSPLRERICQSRWNTPGKARP